MPPIPRFYIDYTKSPRADTVVNQDSGTINHHTTADIIVMSGIFLALIILLSVLAWRHPTSLRSLRAIPMHGAALPTPNMAPPVHFIATHGHTVAYLLHLLGTSFGIHWWARVCLNRIDRVPSHREDTVAHALPVGRAIHLNTRALTPTPTLSIAPTSFGDASTIDTIVDGEAIELCELDGTKGLSTFSLVETNGTEPEVSVGERVIRDHVGPLSGANEPSSSTAFLTMEVDITDVDKVGMGHQALK